MKERKSRDERLYNLNKVNSFKKKIQRCLIIKKQEKLRRKKIKNNKIEKKKSPTCTNNYFFFFKHYESLTLSFRKMKQFFNITSEVSSVKNNSNTKRYE